MKCPASLVRLFLAAMALGLAGSSQAQTPAPATNSAPASAAAPTLDFGDSKSSTLTGKAWGALGSKDYVSLKGYTEKCIELYKAQAITQQASLKEAAPADKANEYWALNDVGTCYFLQGKALDDQGDKKGALAAYKFLAENLSFAQCWDTNGWFWKPADAARKRLVEIQFDAAQ